MYRDRFGFLLAVTCEGTRQNLRTYLAFVSGKKGSSVQDWFYVFEGPRANLTIDPYDYIYV
jgi:nucleoid-associated protein YejK